MPIGCFGGSRGNDMFNASDPDAVLQGFLSCRYNLQHSPDFVNALVDEDFYVRNPKLLLNDQQTSCSVNGGTCMFADIDRIRDVITCQFPPPLRVSTFVSSPGAQNCMFGNSLLRSASEQNCLQTANAHRNPAHPPMFNISIVVSSDHAYGCQMYTTPQFSGALFNRYTNGLASRSTYDYQLICQNFTSGAVSDRR